MKFKSYGFFLIVVMMLYVNANTAQASAPVAEQVIKITSKKFDYTPNRITLKKGVAVVLELTAGDVVMGFNAPDLGARADIIPGKVTRVRIVPNKAGSFVFFCDIFCGSGHEDMSGMITVIE
ncbi:MAG: cupredoxin domain-containing protein [Gammaproteobacteria bacterium]|nr:cupredoxin domain-containing protein [Gammaproteobacteria bacterium]